MRLYGMDVDLLKAIWNGMDMDMDSYVNPHVDFVAWIRTLVVRHFFLSFPPVGMLIRVAFV